MKKTTRLTALFLFVLAAAWVFALQNEPKTPLSGFFPGGSLLYLEARDFGSLLSDWQNSSEKKLWLASDQFSVFSRSRLFLRLRDAHSEYTAAAGFAPDLPLVNSLAGTESALAIYDIGKLEFLYITKFEAAKAVETSLWKARTSYESRSSAGFNYFVRVDRNSKKAAAFAAAGGYLLLATREDLMGNALALIAKRQTASLLNERWYQQSVQAAKGAGELRLVLNIESLGRTPYFTSYWVQRNARDLRQYSAGIVDVFRSPGEIREERVLLRAEASIALTPREPAVAQALSYVPDQAAFYQAWAAPSSAFAANLIHRKIVAPGPQTSSPSDFAPAAASAGTNSGTDADLETRIDEQPLEAGSGDASSAALRAALTTIRLDALLLIQSSRTLPDGVFIGNESAVVLVAAENWNPAPIRAAAPSAFVSSRGRVLVLADTEAALKAIEAKLGSPPSPQGASYAAAFQFARELPPYTKLMGLIDYAQFGREDSETTPTREPYFFSENVAGMGRVLDRLQSVSIVAHDTGSQVPQTVRYRVAQ